ncbi:hypothetical protein Pflav_049940 [Phytohabitans flavus]|uniref:RNA polymerase-binding protein RbpA n=1 Tax=Phytohabitans flavus TaxID=1076124 RepID=A0A6F8XXK7_9ACTN|nr:hypothetical protein Pflav_049940 [Phytohabitans flavus]
MNVNRDVEPSLDDRSEEPCHMAAPSAALASDRALSGPPSGATPPPQARDVLVRQGPLDRSPAGGRGRAAGHVGLPPLRPAGGLDQLNPPGPARAEPYKSHLAYVKERRSDADGEALLAEALAALRRRRGEF